MRARLVVELSAFAHGWRDDGDLVAGPGALAVRAVETHGGGPGHVDLCFMLNKDRQDTPVVWDCVSGGDGENAAAAKLACSIWARTTAPVVFELLNSKGEHAEHAHGDDGLGLVGWHSIHGPILGYGRSDPSALQAWCLDNPVVPALRNVLAPVLPSAWLHGVKFLLGAFGDTSIAEVRIDGVRDDRCSEALLALPWPKDGQHVVRCFVLFVHPEPASPGEGGL